MKGFTALMRRMASRVRRISGLAFGDFGTCDYLAGGATGGATGDAVGGATGSAGRTFRMMSTAHLSKKPPAIATIRMARVVLSFVNTVLVTNPISVARVTTRAVTIP